MTHEVNVSGVLFSSSPVCQKIYKKYTWSQAKVVFSAVVACIMILITIHSSQTHARTKSIQNIINSISQFLLVISLLAWINSRKPDLLYIKLMILRNQFFFFFNFKSNILCYLVTDCEFSCLVLGLLILVFECVIKMNIIIFLDKRKRTTKTSQFENI